MTTMMRQEAAGGEIVLGQNNYGKSDVRLVKVTRRPDRHDLRDLNVAIALEGDFAAAHITGDNTGLLATDTMRNTVYALAKDHPLNSIEEFGLALVRHFLAAGPTVKRARVHIVEYPWNRIEVNGRPHEHSFVRGSGERRATVTGTASDVQVEAGIGNLAILKTTNSGFESYLHEQYTTLPETHDRILATSVTATWSYGGNTAVDFGRLWHGVRDQILATFTDHYSPSVQNTLYRMGKAVLEAYPEVQQIHLSLPNQHHLLFNLAPFGLENNNEIYQATTEPYGLIEGTVQRKASHVQR
jgi:urate oxidase